MYSHLSSNLNELKVELIELIIDSNDTGELFSKLEGYLKGTKKINNPGGIYDVNALPLVEADNKKEERERETAILERSITPNPYANSRTVTPNN